MGIINFLKNSLNPEPLKNKTMYHLNNSSLLGICSKKTRQESKGLYTKVPVTTLLIIENWKN